jgi:hypothetical protein
MYDVEANFSSYTFSDKLLSWRPSWNARFVLTTHVSKLKAQAWVGGLY